MAGEIKVGQVWKQRDGKRARIARRERYGAWGTVSDDEDAVELANIADNGFSTLHPGNSPFDLIELVQDENGFTIWRGGECPVPADATVTVRFRSGEECTDGRPDQWVWGDFGTTMVITAYKLVEQPATDAKALAADMLSDLGWHFDGTTWVQDGQVGFTVEAPQVDATLKVEWESNVFAPTLLIAAAKHMADRAATYDKPDGERSMAQTVAIFKGFHGIEMTEAQGWHFMQILKDVRLFTRATYHADSAEDCIAYAALKAEARAQEGGIGHDD